MERGILISIAILSVLASFSFLIHAIINMQLAPSKMLTAKQRKKVIKSMDLKGDEIVVDMGAGDYGLLYQIYKDYKETQLIGYEISPLLTVRFKFWFKFAHFKDRKRFSFFNYNLFDADISQADVIFYNLDKRYDAKVKAKFDKEAKVGSRLIAFSGNEVNVLVKE